MTSRRNLSTRSTSRGITSKNVTGNECIRLTGKNALMKITIMQNDRKLINVVLYQDTSVKRLREIIFENRQIPPEVQTLTFEGLLLEDNSLLQKDYKIKDSCLIALSLPLSYHPNFKIFVKLSSDELIKVLVHEEDQVVKLKEAIADVLGIPVKEQALSFLSWLMEDNRLIKEYDLKKNSIVRVLQKPAEPRWVDFGNQMTPQTPDSEASFASPQYSTEMVKMRDNITQMTPSIASIDGDENDKEYYPQALNIRIPNYTQILPRRNSILTEDDDEVTEVQALVKRQSWTQSPDTKRTSTPDHENDKIRIPKSPGLVRTPVKLNSKRLPIFTQLKAKPEEKGRSILKPPRASVEPNPQSPKRTSGDLGQMMKPYQVKRPNPLTISSTPSKLNGAPNKLITNKNYNFAKTLLEKKLTGSIEGSASDST